MISVALLISDAELRTRVRDRLSSVSSVQIRGDATTADVAVADHTACVHCPLIYVGPGPVPAPAAEFLGDSPTTGELERAIERVVLQREPASGSRVIACWSPKGGVGTTTLAVNLAAAAFSLGVRVAYADLDWLWGDGATWFGSVIEPDVPDRDGAGLRPLVHGCGLKGFVAQCSDDVEALGSGLRDGFDLAVLDMPGGREPVLPDIDALYLVVGCDLASLRRGRLALDRFLPATLDVRPVVCVRRGAQLRVTDADDVLGSRAVAVLVDEPSLTGWGDRGALIYAHRRSRWAREVRALARDLCAGLVPASPRLSESGLGIDDPLGRLAERLRT